MSNRSFGSAVALSVVVAVLSLAAVPAASAQDGTGLQSGSGGPQLRRLPDKLIVPARTQDDQPDFQGQWGLGRRQGNPYHSIEEGSDPWSVILQGASTATVAGRFANVIVEPPGTIPYQPWAAAKKKQSLIDYFTPTKREHISPDIRCIEGLPHIDYSRAVTVFQHRDSVVFLYSDYYRVIPLDGRPHVGDRIKLYMGDSRGHWEGNTLVVDVTNNSDKVWFDTHGTLHSDAMHLVERWTMIDAKTMYLEFTVEDPKALTQPMKLAVTLDRSGNQKPELWEEGCHEGERGSTHMIEIGLMDKAAGKTGIHEHDKAVRDLWIKKAIDAGAKQGKQAVESLCVRADLCPSLDAKDVKKEESQK